MLLPTHMSSAQMLITTETQHSNLPFHKTSPLLSCQSLHQPSVIVLISTSLVTTVHIYSAFLIMFVKKSVSENLQKSNDCCHFMARSLYWISSTRPACAAKYQTHHEPTFFCSTLVKSEPTWLHPEELQFEAKEHFFYINTDRTTCTWTHLQISVFRSSCIFSLPHLISGSYQCALSMPSICVPNVWCTLLSKKAVSISICCPSHNTPAATQQPSHLESEGCKLEQKLHSEDPSKNHVQVIQGIWVLFTLTMVLQHNHHTVYWCQLDRMMITLFTDANLIITLFTDASLIIMLFTGANLTA